MDFTETGTLVKWSIGDIVVIPEIIEVSENKFRGGAFWCIPNFDQLGYPFEIKHGEYRITKCSTPTLPHEKFLSAESGAGWGKLATRVLWEEKTMLNVYQLETRAHLQALSPMTILRPGFHPYFKVHTSFILEIGGITITSETMPVDKIVSVPAQKNASGNAVATLKTGNLHITVAATMEEDLLRSSTCFSFCIWSDKPEGYICVEPVYGTTQGIDNLPTSFALGRGQTTTLVSKIVVSTMG